MKSAEIQAVVFDMDGVLIDARMWHFRALNEALEIFGASISASEHESRFDGLPTRVKLSMLSAEGRLPAHTHAIVNAVKQERTNRIAAEMCKPRLNHLLLIAWLKQRGIRVGVATNSIRQTTMTMLGFAGLLSELDAVVTNEDVERAKPWPDIYQKAALELGITPSRILVVEDRDVGFRAAQAAGCMPIRVDGVEDVNISLLEPILRLERTIKREA